MARTFIFRHEGVFPGSGRKIVAKLGIHSEKKTRDAIFKQVSQILDTPLREYRYDRWSRYSYRIVTKPEWDLFYRIEAETIFPISTPWRHPARNGLPGRIIKTYYKKMANRLGRRKTREMLKSRVIDHEEMLLPSASQYYDTWDFD